MKILGVYKDTDGKIKNNIYYSFDLLLRDTFSPAIEIIKLIPLKVYGYSYKEKKEDLRQQAIEYQDTFNYVSWSYGELTEINKYLYKNGKRYGLLREFRENGIL